MTCRFTTAGATVLVMLSGFLMTPPAWSQVVVQRRPIRLFYESYYSPATAASLQVLAEAEYLRASGQMQRDFAEARIRNEQARRLHGENRVQDLLNKIKMREIAEADRAQRIREQIAKRRENNEKTWERLKNHPELTSGEIRSGRALNFLKNRLATSLITYQSSSGKDNAAVRDVTRQMLVTSQIIHALQVRQVLDRGESLIFRLDEGRPIQVDWWPPGLKFPELKSARANFERARNEVFEAQNQDAFDDKIRKLLVAHASLEDEFLMLKPHAEWVKTQHSIRVYLDGKAFMKSLVNEIRRLERVGLGQHAAKDLSFQGGDMTELLTHMIRNGLEFAPPRPGDEPVYEQAFHMLKDLYVATEADAAENAGK